MSNYRMNTWEDIMNGRQYVPHVFEIGKRFPVERYCVLGDHYHAVPTETSFDVVVSISDLTQDEITSFADLELTVDLFEFEDVPFIVLNFSDALKIEVSMNVLKIKAEYREYWLNEPNNTVHLYLLEGTDATLQALRTENMPIVEAVKTICANQLTKTIEEVDNVIRVVDSNVHINQMIENSHYRWTHQAPRINCDSIFEI